VNRADPRPDVHLTRLGASWVALGLAFCLLTGLNTTIVFRGEHGSLPVYVILVLSGPLACLELAIGWLAWVVILGRRDAAIRERARRRAREGDQGRPRGYGQRLRWGWLIYLVAFAVLTPVHQAFVFRCPFSPRLAWVLSTMLSVLELSVCAAVPLVIARWRAGKTTSREQDAETEG